MASPEGAVLNAHTSLARITAIVKAGITVLPGYVYEDGANGWKNAPLDGSKLAKDLYWCPKSVGSANETKDKRVTVYDLEGLQVIGKSDGVIPLDGEVKTSETTAKKGQNQSNPEPTSAFTAADDATVDATYGTDESGVITANRTRIAELVTREGAIRAWVKKTTGHYIGHENEILEGIQRTPSTNAEPNCVFVLRRGK